MDLRVPATHQVHVVLAFRKPELLLGNGTPIIMFTRSCLMTPGIDGAEKKRRSVARHRTEEGLCELFLG